MAGAVNMNLELTGRKQLGKALRVLAEKEAPFLNAALEESTIELQGAARQRAPGGIAGAIVFAGVKGTGVGVRGVLRIKHPGGRSREFGRKFYYRNFTGRDQRGGERFRVGDGHGERSRPYLGVIKGDAAIGATKASITARLVRAIDAEWERIGAGSGD